MVRVKIPFLRVRVRVRTPFLKKGPMGKHRILFGKSKEHRTLFKKRILCSPVSYKEGNIPVGPGEHSTQGT